MLFSKWQGLGNDFVIVNGFQENIPDYCSAAKEICDRHFGVGADGLVIIGPSSTADFRMRIFNSDGSEAEMCGNVTRCVMRYVYESALTDKTSVSLETMAGLIRPELLFSDGAVIGARVDMGIPRLKLSEIPLTGSFAEPAVNVPLEIGSQTVYGTAVSMGNPHFVTFVDDVAAVDLAEIGPKIETSRYFPRKTNVEFVQVLNRQELRMRVWERGAGITLACGTGACATLVAAVLNNKTDRKAEVHLPGGNLFVEWGENEHLYISGPATEVFRGEFLLHL